MKTELARKLCRICIGLLCLLVFSITANAADALYRREINQKNPAGKNLVLVMEEVKREEKTSTVKVSFKSGASVPSAMFIIRGCCDIAHARGARYFINLKERAEADGSWTYLIGFANDKNVPLQLYFGLQEPPATTQAFLAVEDYERLFKN